MNRNQVIGLITQIGSREGLSPQQIRAMIATATVESGLNPGAVGDNGTSFGLFQHHIGGAGGGSHSSAIRYHDPVTSITERARWFKKMGIKSGRGAAALQRPADPFGYARKVDAALRGVKVGLNAPVEGGSVSGGVSEPTPTVSGGQDNPAVGMFFERVFKDNPTMLALYKAKQARTARAQAQEAPEPPAPSVGVGATTQPPRPSAPAGAGVDVLPRRKGEPGWRYLQRLGNTLFGLQNDPGNSQTTGGRHTQGSWHYKNTAIDFGTARNSEAQLNRWEQFLNAHRKQLGIVELLNEGDHRHVAIRA